MSLLTSFYTVISALCYIGSVFASSHNHAHAHAHAHPRAHKHSVKSTYSTSSKANVALYWGQGAGQQRLLHFCNQSTVDIIPIAFLNVFPAQGNGFPGDNFGNQCWGPPYVYQGPGNNPSLNQLQSECPQLAADIPVCQFTFGKKIILSLGGASSTYQLTGAAEGVAFADFLWGAFGPQTASWLKSGLPRPFDGPNNLAVEVDGFDFDIEYAPTDSSAGYVAMIQRLRVLFQSASKPYLITGAPQCVVPDANMGIMISQVQFDIIWVQYYNTPQCSARNWVTANLNYASTGVELASGFSYNTWAIFLVGTASANARLYIGVPGGPASDTNYLNPTEIANLAKAYFCKPNFGGIMIWEATVADNNPSGPYYSTVKNILLNYQNSLCLSTSTTQISSKISTLSTISTSVPGSSSKSSSSIWTTTSSPVRISTSKSVSTSSSRLSSTLRTSTSISSTSKSSSSSKSSSVSSIKLSGTLKTSTSLSATSKSSSTSSIKLSSTLKTNTSVSTSSSKLSSSSKTTLTPSPFPTIVVPPGACGSAYGVSCTAGFCCSLYGYCGNTAAYCGTSCQVGFGICS